MRLKAVDYRLAEERYVKPRFRFIPEDIRAWLLSPRLLQEWAPYTIKERVAIAKAVW